LIYVKYARKLNKKDAEMVNTFTKQDGHLKAGDYLVCWHNHAYEKKPPHSTPVLFCNFHQDTEDKTNEAPLVISAYRPLSVEDIVRTYVSDEAMSHSTSQFESIWKDFAKKVQKEIVEKELECPIYSKYGDFELRIPSQEYASVQIRVSTSADLYLFGKLAEDLLDKTLPLNTCLKKMDEVFSSQNPNKFAD